MMRRFIVFCLVMALFSQSALPASAENESGGFFDSIAGGFGAAWEWTQGAEDAWNWAANAAEDAADWTGQAATDAWNWTGQAATDAWNWTAGAAEDAWNWTANAAIDAAEWTGQAATDAWNWTTGAAEDAWKWTQKAAGDAWTWTCETASYTWTVTSRAVIGTWDDIFGELTGAGPHHLCVSSPLFKSTKIIGEWTDESGIYTELFTYGSDYEITLIAAPRGENILPPSVGEMSLAELVASNYDSATFVQDTAAGAGVRAMAQELRFRAMEDGLPVYGRALGVWTDHYIVCFVITSFVPVSDGAVDETLLPEVDRFFDLWMETLSIYETRKYELETARISDAFPAGNLTASNVWTANRIFDETRFHSTKGGQGFAAERANNLKDNIRGVFNGQHSKITGDNNAANGSDRQLIGRDGTLYQIQSKYFGTAYASIYNCFDETGTFRYMDANGKPMQIEVPKEQYDDAVAYMRRYISNGQVPGVTDPDEALNIVKKGRVTYKQAQRIAHAGNVYSLKYDAVNGCIECASSFGISAVVEFAVGMWNGDDVETALKKSVYTGLEVGGSSFVIAVLSSQLSKTGLNRLLVGSSEAVVKLMGPKAAAAFVNAFRPKSIYGAAAMKSAAKLLRGNFITETVSMIVVSVPDTVDAFRGRISGKQLLKNLASTGGGIAGGTGGWFGGAALGSMILPGIGSVIGGIIGSVAGGFTVQIATDAVADLIAEDDADEMLDIVSEEFKRLAEEYLLSESEAEAVAQELNRVITAGSLKDMYAASCREMYAREVFLRPAMKRIAESRAVIELPDNEDYQEVLIDVLEDIYDEMENEGEVTAP